MANFNRAKKYHFIYKTTCLLNNKYYIGMHSTNELNDGYIGSGKRLRRLVKKYGIENFKCEILEFLTDRDSLANREKEIVNEELLKDSDCLNLMCGGHGGFISDEHQQYRSSMGGQAYSRKLKEDSNFRDYVSDKISKGVILAYKTGKLKPQGGGWNKDITISDLHKKRISESKKGKSIGSNNSQYGTCWITTGSENKKIKKEDLETFINLGWKKGRNRK
jgi:hypothetical protein